LRIIVRILETFILVVKIGLGDREGGFNHEISGKEEVSDWKLLEELWKHLCNEVFL
jgi:hypothetical protein